jgi:hypothetical protein
MLKTVSSVTNAIGALNYKGTWNATTNTPTITSSVGVKGDYYQVSVAGSTTINGISNWGVGDVIAFNGTTWQRIEGGADLNGVNLSVSGTTTLSGLTASTALALNAGKDVVSVTNTGTGDNVLATAPTLVGDVTLSTGNLVIGTAGKGIDFSATSSGSGTMTSELLADYEEGTFTPVISGTTTAGTGTYSIQLAQYVKIGKCVQYQIYIVLTAHTGTGNLAIGGLPFTASANAYPPASVYVSNLALTAGNYPQITVATSSTDFLVRQVPTGGGAAAVIPMDTAFDILLSGTYQV